MIRIIYWLEIDSNIKYYGFEYLKVSFTAKFQGRRYIHWPGFTGLRFDRGTCSRQNKQWKSSYWALSSLLFRDLSDKLRASAAFNGKRNAIVREIWVRILKLVSWSIVSCYSKWRILCTGALFLGVLFFTLSSWFVGITFIVCVYIHCCLPIYSL